MVKFQRNALFILLLLAGIAMIGLSSANIRAKEITTEQDALLAQKDEEIEALYIDYDELSGRFDFWNSKNFSVIKDFEDAHVRLVTQNNQLLVQINELLITAPLEFTENQLAAYGIIVEGGWTENDKWVVLQEVEMVANKMAEITGSSDPFGLFRGIILSSYPERRMLIIRSSENRTGCFTSNITINCSSALDNHLHKTAYGGIILHELGHVFDFGYLNFGGSKSILNNPIYDLEGNYVSGKYPDGLTGYVRRSAGYKSNTYPDLQHLIVSPPNNYSSESFPDSYGEDFADMFMNYFRDSFSNDLAGQARYDWMDEFMREALKSIIP